MTNKKSIHIQRLRPVTVGFDNVNQIILKE